MIKIDKDIPVPPLVRGNIKYPWDQMEVGDSFLTDSMSNPFGSARVKRLRGQGWKFTARKEADGRQRVWRIG